MDLWADARREPGAHAVELANEWVLFSLAGLLGPESEPASLLDAVGAIRASVLPIAGSDPKERAFAGVYDVGEVEVWRVSGSPHIGALATSPQGYPERVLGVLERAFGG
jgi:hypothetical protein